MTGIDHRSKRPSPAGAKTPASKHGKDLKVKKLQEFSVPAGPLPCPPGCALVPADLLHQLQSEVSKTALPVLQQEAPEVQHAPGRRKEPEVHHAQREDRLPNLIHPAHATPAAVAAKAPKPRLKDGGARPIVIVKHAGVSTEDTVNGPAAPLGARHASVGTVDAVEEGTQTSPQESVQPAAPTLAPQTVSPTAHSGAVQGNAGDENKAVPWQPPQPVVNPVGMAVFSAGPALPGSPDKMNSTDHGRFDLFGMDKFTAEKDRDRKRLQAQMLAEQIQEQRERKEEELRRKRDEEMREERRLARELREIEERHRHEQAVLSGQADAQSEPTPKVPPGRGHGTGQVRRRKSSKDLACESPAGAGSYTQLRADSSAGPWVDGDERRRRRPRRRRREVESNGLVQDGSWASERDKRTWRDANLSHSMLPDGRDTHSRSPVPWLTASPQENGDQPDGLRPVLETEEMKRTEGRRRRRADRTSMDKRERGDSYDANDTWESAQNRRSHDQDMRARADVSASWQREEEDEQAKRRPGRVPMRRGEQLAAVAEVVESPRQKASQPPTSSDADLREQIQSLVKVCEQLLRERAEERGSRNPKGTPAGGASPNRKTQERPERQSPSPRRLPAVSKHEMIEESTKTGMSGAALGSARGASQASKASKNPTSTEWRTSQPHATPDAGGAPATGGASDMHTFGEAAAPVQPNASGSSNTRPAPADSLSELLQGQSRMIAASEIPEAYIVPYNAAYSAAPAAVAPVGHPDYSRPRPPGVLVEESPFASPARGIAVRRSSRSYRRDSYGGAGRAGWGGRMLASPPLISRGGLNVQANWEPLGVEGGGHPFPFHKGSRRSRGPGQVPIGINPSIQAQSAMLREMYPNVAMGGGGAGPFSRA